MVDTTKTKLQYVALLIVFSVLSVLVSYGLFGFIITSVTTAILVSILLITRPVWLPPSYGYNWVRRVSLYAALLVAGWYTVSAPALLSAISPLLNAFLKNYAPPGAPLPEIDLSTLNIQPPWYVLPFVLLVVYSVNRFLPDRTVMGAHPVPVEKDFPERDYPELLEAYRRSMLRELDLIDQQTNWSDRLFTPLEAEVEVSRSGRPRRQITDLLTALKSEKTNTPALVIGEPGSGKSVALRRLCRTLLDEVPSTGKLPIYINLKEWETETPWSESNLPSIEDLQSFILTNLLDRGDVDAHSFLNSYFYKMYGHHRFFFIIDSFDEMPAVMDVPEDSPLIDDMSLLFSKFFGHATRGVLASRPFKQPTTSFVPGTRVDVRPFDEARIARTLQNSAQLPHAAVRTLFRTAPHLLSLARNPMMASLLASYVRTNPGKIPARQADLYENYLGERLRASSYQIGRMRFDEDSILEASCTLAATMFAEEGLALEAPLETLSRLLPGRRVRDVVAVLRHARIGRVGLGVHERFSFVHRRFNEYFVVQDLVRRSGPLPLQDIPDNGRYRDSLVLYCEVASDDSAEMIARYCWAELTRNPNARTGEEYAKGIHCLRFLAEAFRGRHDCIGEFATALASLIRHNLSSRDDLLAAKLSTEAIGILPDTDIESLVVRAMRLGNSWIRQTALRSCRGEDLTEQMMIYLAELEPWRLLKEREQLDFSLSLSEAFASVRRYLEVLRWDVWASRVGLLIALVISPVLGVLLLLVAKEIFGSVDFKRTTRNLEDQPNVSSHLKTIMRISRSGLMARLTAAMAVVGLPAALFMIGRLAGLESKTWYNGLVFPFTSALISSQINQIAWVAGAVLHMRGLLVLYEAAGFWRTISVQGMLRLLMIFRSNIGVITTGIMMLVLVYSILWAILFGAFKLIEYLDLMTQARWGVVGCFVVLVVVLICIKIGHQVRKFGEHREDARVVSETLFGKTMDRVYMGQRFLLLRTERGRKEFIEALEREVVSAIGEWPDGRVPWDRNDEAEDRLAQLEERWLGLRR